MSSTSSSRKSSRGRQSKQLLPLLHRTFQNTIENRVQTLEILHFSKYFGKVEFNLRQTPLRQMEIVVETDELAVISKADELNWIDRKYDYSTAWNNHYFDTVKLGMN